ncbi:MAG: ester cyclase [Actinomycetota bacterium]
MSDMKDTAREFFASQDRAKGGPAAELLTSDYVANVAGYPPMDLAGHGAFAGQFYVAFPDIVHTVSDTVEEDDKVAVRFRITGTNTGPLMGQPATGKPIDIGALGIMRFVGGKVAEIHSEFDLMGMMQQIGALPTP